MDKKAIVKIYFDFRRLCAIMIKNDFPAESAEYRMKSFVIEKNDADQRLDKFITKTVPALPKNLLYKYIRLKRIKLNGKRAEISSRLKVGDRVDMYINDEFFEAAKPHYEFLKAGKQLDIVFEDENLLILEKRVGLLCHPDKSEYTDKKATTTLTRKAPLHPPSPTASTATPAVWCCARKRRKHCEF